MKSKGVYQWLALLLAYPFSALAVSRIDIQIGELQFDTIKAENLTATLAMDGQWSGKASIRTNLTALEKATPLPVKVSKGSLQGEAHFAGSQKQLQQLTAELNLTDLAFSDADGLKAGEKINAKLSLNAERNNQD